MILMAKRAHLMIRRTFIVVQTIFVMRSIRVTRTIKRIKAL